MSNLGKLLSQETAELYTNIESASQLNLNPLEIDNLKWDKTAITVKNGKNKGSLVLFVIRFANVKSKQTSVSESFQN